MDFQLIPTPSLDFEVALNLGETAPLRERYMQLPGKMCMLCFCVAVQLLSIHGGVENANGKCLVAELLL